MSALLLRDLQRLDMAGAGIDTPTITKEQAVKWQMIGTALWQFSELVRDVARMNLQQRRNWIANIAEKHEPEFVEEFKTALKFEWEKINEQNREAA